MGPLKTVALIILGISLLVFIALFGRLPAFRKTPIGFIHRVMWLHIPRGLAAVDNRLTGGRTTKSLRRSVRYLMHERHPLVLIFFLGLLIGGQAMFIPATWSQLETYQQCLVLLIVVSTYAFLYLGVTTSSVVTHENHPVAVRQYPYDHALYQPGVFCRSCQFPKPARSKHCSVCNVCVAKMDHHCIWLNNCVGRKNYIWFLSLLLGISTMLMYAFILGRGLLDRDIQRRYPGPQIPGSNPPEYKHWTQTEPKMSWSDYFQMWSLATAFQLRIGAITLFAFMAFPLSTGLLGYHIYLLWAGMTTNESAKWGDLRDDIDWGVVWQAKRIDLLEDYPIMHPNLEPREHDIDIKWKGDKTGARDPRLGEGQNNGWWIIRLRSNKDVVRTWRPKKIEKLEGEGEGDVANGQDLQASTHDGPPEMEPGDPDERWHRVKNVQQLVNIYDLGFWDSVKDLIWNRD